MIFEIFGLASLVLYSEVKAMKEACGAAHMKSILAIGELGTMENVYKVSFYIY
jgi:deoxyribose-phosphate aldolase